MRLSRIALVVLIAASTAILARGQQQDAQPSDSQQQEAQPPDQGKPSPEIPLPEDQDQGDQPRPAQRRPNQRRPMETQPDQAQSDQGQMMEPPEGWIPPDVVALRQGASSKIEFSLDHSMLVFASKFDPNDEDLQRVIAGVNGVSVHSYHFPAPGMYDPRILGALRNDYHAAGWKQVMNKYDKNGGPGVTDLWVRLQNNAISDVAILVARSNDVNLIEVAGSISPLDLLHLCGHFGIPRIEGGVVVRNAERR
jgi:Domain of unknown function (DUF4252)